ncbi:hypothetical protein FQA39_LY19355 [Lamprigera yunnana]|nr:hypothetical protein FQA39_LY19355 [Lamprigera yunnana]
MALRSRCPNVNTAAGVPPVTATPSQPDAMNASCCGPTRQNTDYGYQVFLRGIGHLFEHELVGQHGAGRAQYQGVAVGRSLGHGIAGQQAGCAGAVVYEERLAHLLAQFVAHGARQYIGGSASGKGNDHAHRFAGKGFVARPEGQAAGACCRRCGRSCGDAQQARRLMGEVCLQTGASVESPQDWNRGLGRWRWVCPPLLRPVQEVARRFFVEQSRGGAGLFGALSVIRVQLWAWLTRSPMAAVTAWGLWVRGAVGKQALRERDLGKSVSMWKVSVPLVVEDGFVFLKKSLSTRSKAYATADRALCCAPLSCGLARGLEHAALNPVKRGGLSQPKKNPVGCGPTGSEVGWSFFLIAKRLSLFGGKAGDFVEIDAVAVVKNTVASLGAHGAGAQVRAFDFARSLDDGVVGHLLLGDGLHVEAVDEVARDLAGGFNALGRAADLAVGRKFPAVGAVAHGFDGALLHIALGLDQLAGLVEGVAVHAIRGKA